MCALSREHDCVASRPHATQAALVGGYSEYSHGYSEYSDWYYEYSHALHLLTRSRAAAGGAA